MAEISRAERAELLSLLAAYCDNTISNADGARLEELLLESEFRDEAGAIYLDYVSLHWDLRKEVLREEAIESLEELPSITADLDWFIQEVPLTGEATPDFPSFDAPAAQSTEAFSFAAVLSEYSLALTGLASVLAILLMVSSFIRLASQGPAPPMPGFAVLKTVRDCEWGPNCRLATLASTRRLQDGVDIAPGEVIDLTTGSAEIAIASGAELVIDAPARLILVSKLRCKLELGRVYAKVSPRAIGFTIAIPTMDVTDLGTEFGIEVFGAGQSEVHVLTGKVAIGPEHDRDLNDRDLNAEAFLHEQRLVEAGAAVRVTEDGGLAAIPSDPARFIPAPGPKDQDADAGLDLVDLVCGGDGFGRRQGTAIDPGSGAFGVLRDMDRSSDGVYHRMASHRVLDGCFLPNGSTCVDSAGRLFEFPRGSTGSGYLICAGGGVDPMRPDRIIPDELRGTMFPPSPRRKLLMHPNVGLTFDLASIRRYARRPIVGLRASVFDPDVRGWKPKGDVYVIVDGVSRFERRGFTVDDAPFPVEVVLHDTDRFLTLATTDGGDSGVGDWITWTDAVLETAAP